MQHRIDEMGPAELHLEGFSCLTRVAFIYDANGYRRWCIDCGSELGRSAMQHETDEMGRVFTAGYRSPCTGCSRKIRRGQWIRWDGQGGYLHAYHTPVVYLRLVAFLLFMLVMLIFIAVAFS